MVYAFVALNLLWVPVWFFFVGYLTTYRWWSFLTDIIPFALAALAVMVATYYVTRSLENNWLLLLSRMGIAAVLYYVVMRLAHVKILDECQQFVLQKIGIRHVEH
jgi:hypothetical protein